MSNQDDSTFMPVTAEPHLFEYGIAGAAVLFFGWLYYWLNTPNIAPTLPITSSAVVAAPTTAPLSPLPLALDTSALSVNPKANLADTSLTAAPITTPVALDTATATVPSTPLIGTNIDAPAVTMNGNELNQLRAELSAQQQTELANLRTELNAAHELALNQVRTEMTERQQSEINQLRTQLAAQTPQAPEPTSTVTVTTEATTPSVTNAPVATPVAPIAAVPAVEPVPTVVLPPVELNVTPPAKPEPIAIVETTTEPTPDLVQFEQQLTNQLKQPVFGQPLVLDQVTFDFGSTALNTAAMNQLKVAAQSLNQYPNANILIRSHTDNIGDFNNNSILSLMRSNNIKNELVKLGVTGSRIRIEGVGPLHPIASNDTEEGRRKNRRTEIIVTE